MTLPGFNPHPYDFPVVTRQGEIAKEFGDNKTFMPVQYGEVGEREPFWLSKSSSPMHRMYKNNSPPWPDDVVVYIRVGRE